jgi:molybdopterin-binding protein
MGELKTMIRDVVRDTVRDVVREELKQAGMIVESTQNSNESIQFKVGQHLFIGKVTKIKKLEK